MDFLQQYSGALTFLATAILVAITAFYAYWTKGILAATANQSRLSLNPVIGIKVKKINISETFGPKRRNLSVVLELTNVGNAPAIEVLVDSEIELRYSQIEGQRKIPARYEPDMVPFIQPGQTIGKIAPNFGNDLITHFFDDVRESHRLNIHRIETDPTKSAFLTSRLRVFVYYRNSLGQHFQSAYEVEIGHGEIPDEASTSEVHQAYVPRPTFHASPIEAIEIAAQVQSRDAIRHLCGW